MNPKTTRDLAQWAIAIQQSSSVLNDTSVMDAREIIANEHNAPQKCTSMKERC